MEMVVHFRSLGIWEAEKGGSGVQGLPQLHDEFKALSQTKQTKLKKIKEISLPISRTTRDSFLTQESLSIHMKEGVDISKLISKSICYHKKMNEKSDVGEVVDKSSNQVVSNALLSTYIQLRDYNGKTRDIIPRQRC